MSSPRQLFLLWAFLGAAALPAWGGSYSQDFSSFFLGQTDLGGGTTLTSSIPNGAVAHIEDGALKELQLSQWDITNSRSAFLLPDLDPGNRIYAFSASWVAPVYGDFPNAGEGFSFSFGPVRPLNLVTGAVESGYGAGLTFSVKTGTNNPGFYLLRNGAVIAAQTNNPTADWGNFSSTRHAFQVDWDNDTGLTVRRNGSPIFTNVNTEGFVPAAGDSFVWAARGGDASQTYRIDNISITTVTQAVPTIRAVWATNQFSPTNIVSAEANTRGLDTTVIFQLGTNTAYGVSATQVVAAASGLVSLSQPFLFDTDRQIPLHARVTASNALGNVTSSDVVFSSSPFEKLVNAQIPGTASGALWADMNDDGLLDLAVHGIYGNNPTVFFCINRGNAVWTARGATHTFQSTASVGDFDNDNRPDVFLAGGRESFGFVTGGDIAHIAYGVASNQLNRLDTQDLLVFPFYLNYANSLVADFDHDGRQDILISGEMMANYANFTNAPDPLVGSGFTTRLMRNEFPGARGGLRSSYFRMMTTPLRSTGWSPLSDYGFISKGDLDGDGFPDIYSHGFSDPTDPLYNLGWEILRNDGEMGLAVTQKGNRSLGEALHAGSCNLWADFNGDGLEDLLVAEGTSFPASGDSPSAQILLLLNDGQGHLTNSGPPLAQVSFVSLAVGDIFNHGRNDIILNSDEFPVLILRNDGNGVFTALDYGFEGVDFGSGQGQGMKLADYDRDGRLDFCRIGALQAGSQGFYGNSDTTVIYRNELDIPSNAPPQAPVNLSTVVGPGTVTFHWGGATDDITPTNLLTYNLRVGTNSLGTSVVSPLADVTNGWRKVAEPGNCRHVFSTVYRFPPGTYYWSVQAVDGALAGGAWATEQTFTITEPERPKLTIAQAVASQHTVSRPARFSDYTLQQTASLSITNWTPVTNAPFYDDGKIKVAVTNGSASSFFRLSKP